MEKQAGFRSPATAADLAKKGYREQYGVIVVCKDEATQKQIYAELAGRGLKCKVVTT